MLNDPEKITRYFIKADSDEIIPVSEDTGQIYDILSNGGTEVTQQEGEGGFLYDFRYGDPDEAYKDEK